MNEVDGLLIVSGGHRLVPSLKYMNYLLLEDARVNPFIRKDPIIDSSPLVGGLEAGQTGELEMR